MKKLLIGVLAALCCLAIAAPVLAEVKVGGMVQSDMYNFERSKERLVAGGLLKNATTLQDSWSTTRLAMPQAFNRLNVQYTSDDKKIGGFIEIRTGGVRGQGTAATDALNGQNFVWEIGYIDWHLNPNFYLRVGRQTQTFSVYTPSQFMGHVDGHIVGAGFGNLHGGTSRDAIRAYIKFNDNVRMEIQALDPNTEAALSNELSIPGAVTAGTNSLEANTIPRFDISLPIKIANFTIEPSFTWLKQSYDQAVAGNDDSYDIWGASLGGKAGFGPFSISAEISYAKNMGPSNILGVFQTTSGGNYVGAATGGPATYLNTALQTKIQDGKDLAFWIQPEFNFGPAAIQLVFGYDKGSNDGDPTISRDASEWDIVQKMYGLNVPIFIAKNFTIVPQIWFYDYDDDAKIGGAAGSAARSGINTDRGTETMIGVTFQLVF